jgi:hypothetical protein
MIASVGRRPRLRLAREAVSSPTPVGGCRTGDASYFSLQISVEAGAPLDLLASMVARGPAAVHLYAARPEPGADLQVDVTSASGQVGDTVQVGVTIRNLGPSPEPYWGIGPINIPPDAELLGVSGCGPRTLSANQYPCGRDDPQRVGTTVTVYLRFRITRRPATSGDTDGGFSFLQAYPDPNPHNLTLHFTVKVAGSATGSGGNSGAGGGPGGGSGSGGGAPARYC